MNEDASFNYVKFRYTFDLSSAECTDSVLNTVREFLGTISLDQRSYQSRVNAITIGIERFDKFGEPYPKHMHMHFKTKDTVGALRARIMTVFKSIGEKRKGNAVYSLKQEKDVKDENRFFRYPWKQMKHPEAPVENKYIKEYQMTPEEFDASVQSEIAYDEWLRDCDFHREKRRIDDLPSARDLVFQYLDTIAHRLLNKKDVLMNILQYYLDNERPANKATILGYMTTALLRYNIQTPEQMADEWLA